MVVDGSEYVDVTTAAAELGVTTRHVARLGARGEIRFAARGLVVRSSVQDYLQQREASRARAWSEETAWGAVALLSGVRVDWLGATQTSRLRSRLRELAGRGETGARELVGRARNRAAVTTYDSFGFLAPAIRPEVVVSSESELGLAGRGAEWVDGYLSPDQLTTLDRRFGLQQDPRGTLVLRATSFDLTVVGQIATVSSALAALDAASSLDVRERGVGGRHLAGLLQQFAGAGR